jgi:hypothetical protein
MDDTRATLEQLARERGADYTSLSRIIGRNAAYVQQYLRRGVPRRLAEEDRRKLAEFFGVSEERLGGPPAATRSTGGLVPIPRLDIGAAAGAGALPDAELTRGRLGFDAGWLRRLGATDARRLSLIGVEGDSMAPTLSDGDDILVDGADGERRLRDGIYVLRLEDALVVKRIAVGPSRERVSICSDNPAYPGWPDCPLSAISLVGRVIWVGRRL